MRFLVVLELEDTIPQSPYTDFAVAEATRQWVTRELAGLEVLQLWVHHSDAAPPAPPAK